MSGLRLHSCPEEELPRSSDYKRKSDREKVASSEEEAARKKCQGEKDIQANSRQQEGPRAVKIQRCQGQTRSRESCITKHGFQEKEMSKQKEF